MNTIETLEGRILMRGGVIGVQDHVLTISGTSGDDRILLRGGRNNLIVTLNGRETTITRKKIRLVVVYCGAGNDSLDAGGDRFIPGRAALEVPARIDGGTGNDTLYSGGGDDTLLGSHGQDRLYGMENSDGADYHDGGPGNDRLHYAGVMYGGSGRDLGVSDYATGAPIIGGLELIGTTNDLLGGAASASDPRPPSSLDYTAELYTRRGRLTFGYQTDTGYDYRFGTPTVREDGRYEVTLRKQYQSNDYQPPTDVILATFDPAKAARRGIVVRELLVGQRSTTIYERVVLVPPL